MQLRKANASMSTVEDGAIEGDYLVCTLQKLDDSGVAIIGKKFEKQIIFRLNGVIQSHEGISIKEKMIPLVRREPELIHGIRNIVHNALKFSKSNVDINLITNSKKINLEITDDGEGFPNDITSIIGEPFLKRSNFSLTEVKNRTSEEGMGLGLFIANILLEKTNGQLRFSNIKQIEK